MGVGMVMSTKLDIVNVIFIGVSRVSIQNMILKIYYVVRHEQRIRV